MQTANSTIPLNKAILLDRDRVINCERGEYTFRIEDFEMLPDVRKALQLFRQAGYPIFEIFNQVGIAKKLYSREILRAFHESMRQPLPLAEAK